MHGCLLSCWLPKTGTFSFSRSNKSLLKKLLVDSGGLLLALQPLGCCNERADQDQAGKVLSDWFNLPLTGQISPLPSLYFSLLFECLSTLMSGIKVEFGAADADQAPAGSTTDRFSPPPLKKPRLADECPYGTSDFDLLLRLDDGTLVPANRAAVAQEVSSEYFRALLGGGFGESLAAAEEAIAIKGVTVGMLVPVLHYLHGCCLSAPCVDGERGGGCPVLEALVLKGLGHHSTEELVFPATPLGEVMVGACRFLVTELQRELERLCVSLLLSRSYKASRKDTVHDLERKPAKESQESTEDNLVNRTSELELTGDEKDGPAQGKAESSCRQQGDAKEGGQVEKATGGDRSSDHKTVGARPVSGAEDAPSNGPVSPANEEPMLEPKLLKSAAQDSSESTPAALLPQLYWFSQQYSYPALGRACLSLLLGCELFSSSSVAGDCLRRLASEGGAAETLRKDLLSLAAAALEKKGVLTKTFLFKFAVI